MRTIVTVVLLSCLSLACAGARDTTRVEPLLFLPHQRDLPLPLRTGDVTAAAFLSATCSDGTRGTCRHVSVRLDTVLSAPAPTAQERNRVIALLLGISDYNCSAFTARAFGRKAQLQTANSILNSVNRVLSAKSDRQQSLSRILTVAGEAGNDILLKPSQLGSAETVVEMAIGDERRKLRNEIVKRAADDVNAYSLLDALGDLANYDCVCSLERGKELAIKATTEAERDQALAVWRAITQQQSNASTTLVSKP